MNSFYKISETHRDDLDQFKNEIDRFRDGEFTDRTFKALRVPRGIYEQREDGTFMVRIRVPGGGITPDQIRQIAKIGREHGDGVLHLTTRQDIQIHYVKIDSIKAVTDLLLEASLSSKGGGGNTVRNIMSCDLAGVCSDEIFDVTPYAIALTELFMDTADSFNLPRKFKLAFSGCGIDCGLATVNDLGFIAKRENDQFGFKIYVAGGMGGASRVAEVLEDFVPIDQVANVATAIKRLFFKHGDRKNRNKARLRFARDRLGREKFHQFYREELDQVKAEGGFKLDLRPIKNELPQIEKSSIDLDETPTFRRWKNFNVESQKQINYVSATIAVPLGNIAADKFVKLADLAEEFGSVRTSQNQNLRVRNIPENRLIEFYEKLAEIGFELADDSQSVVSCPGANTCRLGICFSRNLGAALHEDLNSFDKKVGIKINGCPNACGQHPIAQIGLQGEGRRIDGELMPHYKIHLGGRVEEDLTEFGEFVGRIPAKDVPQFLNEFLDQFDLDKSDDFYEFLERSGKQIADGLITRFSSPPSIDENKNYYCDWGSDDQFSLAGIGEGECSAGMFALIGEDIKQSEQAIRASKRASANVGEKLHEAISSAARALLITRGIEAKTDQSAFYLFTEHFIANGLADPKFLKLFRIASESKKDLAAEIETITELIDHVRLLYSVLNVSTLQFDLDKAETPETIEKPKQTLDLRGLHCVPNYAQIKLELAKLSSGDGLIALVDDGDSIQNVPASIRKDGHKIVEISPIGDHFQLTIEKG